MSAPTSPAADEKSETEISNLQKHPTQIEANAERIRSSVARLTSNSVDELEGLTSELQALQDFLKLEVNRVQGEIQSALDGIKIIIETIAPWKSIADSAAPPSEARAARPATNTGLGSRPYGKMETSMNGAPRSAHQTIGSDRN
jgi:hypothetical protein